MKRVIYNSTKRFEDKGALTVLVTIREPKQKCLKSRLESTNGTGSFDMVG